MSETALERKLIKGAEGKPEAITLALDDLVLAAKLDFLSLKVLSYRCLEDALKDHLEALGYSIFSLQLMALPQALVLARPRIKCPVLLNLRLALGYLRRAHVELGGGWGNNGESRRQS